MANSEASFVPPDKSVCRDMRERLKSIGAGENWKQRLSSAGVHYFNRASGLHVLLDEVQVPAEKWSQAPRQLSIALTNRCDLSCQHCYAPKSRAELSFDDVIQWAREADANGTLGVGFGGGEPTLYPRFAELCAAVASGTQLSVSFTTHGHGIDAQLAEHLTGNIHFIRVSMDGVHSLYESIRRRPFQNLLDRLPLIKSIAPFGVNVVVNSATVGALDDIACISESHGASELLLLPQVETATSRGIDSDSLMKAQSWTDRYTGELKLYTSALNIEDFPVSDPLIEEQGVVAYMHIDAHGYIKETSYAADGVKVDHDGLLSAITTFKKGLL